MPRTVAVAAGPMATDPLTATGEIVERPCASTTNSPVTEMSPVMEPPVPSLQSVPTVTAAAPRSTLAPEPTDSAAPSRNPSSYSAGGLPSAQVAAFHFAARYASTCSISPSVRTRS